MAGGGGSPRQAYASGFFSSLRLFPHGSSTLLPFSITVLWELRMISTSICLVSSFSNALLQYFPNLVWYGLFGEITANSHLTLYRQESAYFFRPCLSLSYLPSVSWVNHFPSPLGGFFSVTAIALQLYNNLLQECTNSKLSCFKKWSVWTFWKIESG